MIDPLFVPDLETIMSQLRLSGLRECSDPQALLGVGLLHVRSELFKCLGADRITDIQAIVRSENPTTDDELLRARAELLEREMLWCYLVQTQPVLLQDGAGSIPQMWNQEGTFRGTSVRERERLLSECQLRVRNLVACILGADYTDNSSFVSPVNPYGAVPFGSVRRCEQEPFRGNVD